MRRPLFALALFVASVGTLTAAEPTQAQSYEQCQAAAGGVTVKLRACDVAELRRRDAALNQVYTELMRTLPPLRRERLRAAERAWIGFRDAECAFRTTAEAGGSAAPLVAGGCHLELTASRIRDLRQALRVERF